MLQNTLATASFAPNQNPSNANSSNNTPQKTSYAAPESTTTTNTASSCREEFTAASYAASQLDLSGLNVGSGGGASAGMTAYGQSTSPTQYFNDYKDQQIQNHQNFSTSPQIQCSEQIKRICDEMGYAIFQENGQRKFCSPKHDPSFKLDKGCEVFIGKIPRDCFEDELIPIFNNIGKIYELRLMMDFSGTTRGFGFVSYFNSDDAQQAVAELNNYELHPGKKIGVCLSIDNCRLFIGGIPKSKTKSEIIEEMSKITENVVDVIVYPSVTDKMKNRGFAFVEYETHRDAAMARRRLIPGKISLWGNAVAVDWAEPELEVPKDIMQNVKILYVRNLMLSTSEEFIRNVFAEAAECNPAEIERVKKIKDFAFIHFVSRSSAIRAMRVLDGTKIEGSVVEVTLAKPVDKNSHFYNKINRINSFHKLPPSIRFFNQLIHQQNMFQPGMPPAPQHPQAFYHPSAFKHIQAPIAHHHQIGPPHPVQHYNDPIAFHSMMPSNLVVGIPDAANQYKSQHQLSCVQLLEDICLANHWGTPSYDMSICSRETGVLYTFQVKIPKLSNFYSEELLLSIGCDKFGVFSPKDFISGLEDSKEMCAGRVISSLDALIQNDYLQAAGTPFRSPSHLFYPSQKQELPMTDFKSNPSSPYSATPQSPVNGNFSNGVNVNFGPPPIPTLSTASLYNALPNIVVNNSSSQQPQHHSNGNGKTYPGHHDHDFDVATLSDPTSTTNLVTFHTASNSLCSESAEIVDNANGDYADDNEKTYNDCDSNSLNGTQDYA